jgi:hypothetical protein
MTVRPGHGASLAGSSGTARVAGAGVLAGTLLAVALLSAGRNRSTPMPARRARLRDGGGDALGGPWRGEARDLSTAAAALCLAVLADSAVEHYRGRFENPGMIAPLLSSTLGLVVGLDGAAVRRLSSDMRRGSYRLAAAVGIAGLAFHLYNVGRRPGGFGWLNFFYAAPLGAPAALTLAGVLGASAERLAASRASAPRLAGVAAGRALCGLVAAGLLGTVGEVALLHYRGSFQNPVMWAPVSLPPIAAALTAKAALDPSTRRDRVLTRLWLRMTALLGMLGVGFHARGVSRAMGGWRNWRQNALDGPPLPAPPSFSALALAGLAALRVRERERA